MSSSTLEWITAIGAITTPIIILILFATMRFSDFRRGHENIRQERTALYNDLVYPLIILFTYDDSFEVGKKSKSKSKYEIAEQLLKSIDYQKTSFNLTLIGPDQVIRAHNALMQYIYSLSHSLEKEFDDPTVLIHKTGDLLLSIRRDTGRNRTTLDHLEMLGWLIANPQQYQEV